MDDSDSYGDGIWVCWSILLLQDPDLVPHTNKNYTLECVTNSTANEAGKLVSKFNETAPTCVPRNTCRAPWPAHPEYEVEAANLKKAYNPGG